MYTVYLRSPHGRLKYDWPVPQKVFQMAANLMSSYNFYPKTAKVIVNPLLGRGEGTQILSRI